MADIKQAAKWMQEGKSVSSFDSGRGSGIYMSCENEVFYQIRNGVRVDLTINDLLADDWELVEPQGKVPNE